MKKELLTFRQIASLRHLLKKWQTRALSHSDTNSTGCLSPSFTRHHRSPFLYHSDEECPPSSPLAVPQGYLAVYVGAERMRFIIPTGYLSRPLFRPFLDKAEEEFGFDHQGALTIPCEVSLFKQVLRAMEGKASEELLKDCSAERECSSSSAILEEKACITSSRVNEYLLFAL